MVRDVHSSSELTFWVKLLEPELSPSQLEEQAQWLYADLQALSGLRQTRFTPLYSPREEGRIQDGVQFEAGADHLRAILRRLCDRLDDRPLETLLVIQQGAVKLAVQTHSSVVLAGIVEAAEALLPPQSIYRAKVETYGRLHGELSPAEEANLDVLRQRLGLSVQDAEALKAIALGPYKTLADKRRHFQTVLMAELARESPLSEATWDLLEELASQLGLPLDVAQALYQDRLHQIQVEAEAVRQQQAAAAEAVRQEAEQAQYAEQRQQEQAEQQNQLDQYRQMVCEALATTLDPRAFDAGRLEQARCLWGIDPTTAQELEEAVRSELHGSIQSALGIDYSRLRRLLWAQSWRDADEATEQALLRALGKHLAPLNRETILQLPCLDVLTLDQLWSRYSDGKFGFRAQQRIYQQVERRPADLLRALDWCGPRLSLTGGLKPYKNFQFSRNAPPGHLPTWRWCCPSLESGYDISETMVEAVFKLLDKCLPPEAPPPLVPIALGESSQP